VLIIPLLVKGLLALIKAWYRSYIRPYLGNKNVHTGLRNVPFGYQWSRLLLFAISLREAVPEAGLRKQNTINALQ